MAKVTETSVGESWLTSVRSGFANVPQNFPRAIQKKGVWVTMETYHRFHRNVNGGATINFRSVTQPGHQCCPEVLHVPS